MCQRIYKFSLVLSFLFIGCRSEKVSITESRFVPVLVIHGGAGNIDRRQLNKEVEDAYRLALEHALKTGYLILEKGGTSIDAVEATIVELEDSPLFNAGKGSVTNLEGEVEMDASIMEGSERKAGAVALVSAVKNPVKAARAVMEKTRHVMLAGDDVDEFAKKQGLELMPPSYFVDLESGMNESPLSVCGTVGAVAVDKNGNLAAGTSTGGLAGKMAGRIGDSPVIGAGTYADNATCAVSCTGQGEFFIRLSVAKEISTLINYQKYSVQQACDNLVKKQLPAMGGAGGVIAVDAKGNVGISFNTTAMFRAYRNEKGSQVEIFD